MTNIYRFVKILTLLNVCFLLRSYGQNPQLVKNITTNPISPNAAKAEFVGKINNGLFFFADDAVNGRGFWKTDGTEAGTVRLKDLVEGTSVFDIYNIYPGSVTVNGTLFFVASNTAFGQEVWKTDGTAAGTVLIKDIYLGTGGSSPAQLFNVNGTVFLIANDSTHGLELWKTDGTEAGTVLVKDTYPGSVSQSPPRNFAAIDDILYFVANNNTNGRELWRSNGTESGTFMVKDILPGVNNSSPFGLTNLNGTLFFAADNGVVGRELWKSDGTEAGTVLVKDIHTLNTTSGIFPDDPFININGILYFPADDGTYGRELWKTDGTTEGTVLVKNVSPSPGSGTFFSSFLNVENTLFFIASSSPGGYPGIWKSDGTAAGTVLVKAASSSETIKNLTASDTLIFFTFNSNTSGEELWKSDGTAAGTVMVKDITPTPFTSSSPTSLFNVNSAVYFLADDKIHGNELWKSDGTESGTLLVKDIYPVTAGSLLDDFNNINGVLYFTAGDNQLWKSDGTANGTVKYFSGTYPPQSYINYATVVDSTLFFVGNDSVVGNELWKSDGTEAGTVLVKDTNPAFNYNFTNSPNNLANINNKLFFSAYDSFNGRELWKSDGTGTGTIVVKDIYAGFNSSTPENLTNVNGTAYFTANDGINGVELWKSDGTDAGTVLVKDIYSGNNSSSPRYLTNVNGILYFAANNGINGFELWKSDGTAAGTVMIKDLYSGNNDSSPTYFTNVNGTVFFRANDGISGEELWKSDGTAVGTVKIKDIRSGSIGSIESQFVNVNGTVFFQANDGVNGSELWKSDGTAAGTIMVKDINPGFSGTDIQASTFTVVNNNLFFVINAASPGGELWKSDGTNAGTYKINGSNFSLDRPYESQSPYAFLNINGVLFFTAKDPINGKELWKFDTNYPCPSQIVLVNPDDNISSGTVLKQTSAIGGITASNQVLNSAVVSYESKTVLLINGFYANPEQGGVFKAQLGGCN